MDESNELMLVITTTETRADAERLAEALMEQTLAACVQIDGPIHSHYRWSGSPRVSSEYRLMIKSRQGIWSDLQSKLSEIHPYEEPEIVMIPVTGVSAGYRAWVIEQTS